MLIAAPSTTVEQDQLSVVYDHNPVATIATLARFARARDPYGMLPPGAVNVVNLTQQPIDVTVLSDVHRSVVDRALNPKDAPATKPSGFEVAVRSLASWLSVGPAIALPRGFLFRPNGGGSPSLVPGAANAEILGALDHLASLDTTHAATWLDDEATHSLSALTLWCGFEALKSAPYYSGPINDIPPGAEKNAYAEAIRIRRLVALLAVLRDSITLAELREQAEWVKSPIVAPLLEYSSPDFREMATTYADQILRIKVHPWIAEAERMRLPARRYTEWGSSSVTMGLTRQGLFERFRLRAEFRGANAAVTTDARGFIISEMVAPFREAAEQRLLFRAMLDPTDVAQAEAVLGLTSPGAAPNLHLHGQTWKALVMTGDMASEALSDVLTLLTRPRFPLRGGTGPADLAGNVAAFEYSAAYWTTRQNGLNNVHPPLTEPEHLPPLFVPPERPAAADGYSLYQITADMLKPLIPSEYFGDEDITDADYTHEGVASLLGYPSWAALPGSIQAKINAALFVGDANTGFRPKFPAQKVFHSPRTRKPWLTAVHVAEGGMPTKVIALNARTAPVQRDILAVVFRTPDRPTMTAATQPFADALAQKAVSMLGVKT